MQLHHPETDVCDIFDPNFFTFLPFLRSASLISTFPQLKLLLKSSGVQPVLWMLIRDLHLSTRSGEVSFWFEAEHKKQTDLNKRVIMVESCSPFGSKHQNGSETNSCKLSCFISSSSAIWISEWKKSSRSECGKSFVYLKISFFMFQPGSSSSLNKGKIRHVLSQWVNYTEFCCEDGSRFLWG